MTVARGGDSPAPLIELRVTAGLSRERLGALAGLSARTIYNIERRGARPKYATREALANALGCDPDAILPLDDGAPVVDVIAKALGCNPDEIPSALELDGMLARAVAVAGVTVAPCDPATGGIVTVALVAVYDGELEVTACEVLNRYEIEALRDVLNEALA